MQSDMDQAACNRFSGGRPAGRAGQQTTGWMPRIDVKQRGDDLVVHADLAGVKPEDVDISITDGVLTISGQRSEESKREDENWVVRERSYGSFQRQMVLPEGVDPNSIHANFNNGVLDVEIPKALEAGTAQDHQGPDRTGCPAGRAAVDDRRVRTRCPSSRVLRASRPKARRSRPSQGQQTERQPASTAAREEAWRQAR